MKPPIKGHSERTSFLTKDSLDIKRSLLIQICHNYYRGSQAASLHEKGPISINSYRYVILREDDSSRTSGLAQIQDFQEVLFQIAEFWRVPLHSKLVHIIKASGGERSIDNGYISNWVWFDSRGSPKTRKWCLKFWKKTSAIEEFVCSTQLKHINLKKLEIILI